MLSFNQVEGVINSEINPKIKEARCMADKLALHVDGIGMQDSLSRINGYENKYQAEAREKHAISNKFLSEELLRPVDNAFHARGGSKNYKFKSKGKEADLIDKLVSVKSNMSLSEYIEQEWFHRFITDPNGLIFMEVSNDEDENLRGVKPTYKNIHSIRDYQQNGIFIDWVIFEPHEVYEADDKEKKSIVFWAVDELYYYLYKRDKEGLKLLVSIDNSFSKVPAILCSNIVDNVTGWKKSAIDSQVELLDKYLVSNSVLAISEFFHNYLREWSYVGDCKTCAGSGKVGAEENVCSTCSGTGEASKKDVTDVLKLKIPDANDVKIDPPAGYIYAPIDAWEAQTNSVDRTWDIIYFSQWGTTVSKDTNNETATGRFLDAQPVNNRLNKYSKSIEQAHTEIANFIGKFYFPETFEGAVIQYGRRYLIETPDQIWDKYIKAKQDNAPVTTLDLLLSQYLESEFRENEQLFVYEMKKTKLEPFIHWDINLVKGLGVNQIDFYKKLYFSDWIQGLEVNYVIDTDINKLNEELTVFVSDKVEPIKEDKNEEV